MVLHIIKGTMKVKIAIWENEYYEIIEFEIFTNNFNQRICLKKQALAYEVKYSDYLYLFLPPKIIDSTIICNSVKSQRTKSSKGPLHKVWCLRYHCHIAEQG